VIVERLLRIALVGSSWVLYLLLGLSVVSITAMLERWLFFRRHRDDTAALRRRLAGALREGDLGAAEKVLAASPSIEARVVREALRFSDGGPEAVADAVDSELCAAKAELERGMSLLGTLGNNAPFIGLFGTVLGVIEAFHQLGAGANKAAMGNVMGGIAEALVATGVGLFVALPAVVAYNVIQKRIGEVETAVAGLGKLVTAAIKARRGRGGELSERAAEPKRTNGAASIAAAAEG
jgi:biopolymer transport protein ExbB/TolQ